MSKTMKTNENVEIVVSTYFPTRIIKTISIKDLTKENLFRSEVILSRENSEYLYEQLKAIYEPDTKEGAN